MNPNDPVTRGQCEQRHQELTQDINWIGTTLRTHFGYTDNDGRETEGNVMRGFRVLNDSVTELKQIVRGKSSNHDNPGIVTASKRSSNRRFTQFSSLSSWVTRFTARSGFNSDGFMRAVKQAQTTVFPGVPHVRIYVHPCWRRATVVSFWAIEDLSVEDNDPAG